MGSVQDANIVLKLLDLEMQHRGHPLAEQIQQETKDPFKVLISTILSARTKDETTGLASRRLFEKVHNVKDLEKISQKEIEQLIYPVGFYITKAKHLKELPIVAKEKFNYIIPETLEGLMELPGVGRKTANLVLSVGFQKEGLCIDTHCHRIPQRLGWLKSKNPFETEMNLRKNLPKKHWHDFNRIIVRFGQTICKPVGPRCSVCPITKYCNYYGNVYLKKKETK